MIDKRITEVLRKKDEIENEIKKINVEIASLKKAKENYENKGSEQKKAKFINDYLQNVKKLSEEINEKEQQKKKLEDIKKEMSVRIRTIKASTTKLENKRIIIETVNCEIKNLNKEINILHIEKLKELRELMKGNNGQFNKLEKEIANWQNFVEFYKNDEKKLEIVRKQLTEAKDAFDEKEHEMANKFEQICQKYDNMKLEKRTVLLSKVEELKKINKTMGAYKNTIEKSFAIIYNLVPNVLPKVEIKPQIDTNIIKEQTIKFEEQTVKLQETNKTNDSIINNTLESKPKSIPISDENPPKDNKKVSTPKASSEKTSPIPPSIIETFETVGRRNGGPIYNQAYRDMIRRNRPLNSEKNVTGSETEETCKNTLVYNTKKRKILKKIVLRESNTDDIQNRYVDIDGIKFEVIRDLDKETQEEIDFLCKSCLKDYGKFKLKDKFELKILKSKLDPAVINAIKQFLNLKFDESKKILIKDKSFDSKSPEGIDKLKNLERKYNYQKQEFLRQYIEFINEKNPEKLSFYLTYDCTEKLSATRYLKVIPLINEAQKAGAIITEKQTLQETIKGIFKDKKTKQNLKTPKYIEGDKSFVPKVGFPQVATIKSALSHIDNGVNLNRNMNNYNHIR